MYDAETKPSQMAVYRTLLITSLKCVLQNMLMGSGAAPSSTVTIKNMSSVDRRSIWMSVAHFVYLLPSTSFYPKCVSPPPAVPCEVNKRPYSIRLRTHKFRRSRSFAIHTTTTIDISMRSPSRDQYRFFATKAQQPLLVGRMKNQVCINRLFFNFHNFQLSLITWGYCRKVCYPLYCCHRWNENPERRCRETCATRNGVLPARF